MALFRVDYSGRGELSERQQKVTLFHSNSCPLLMLFSPQSSPRFYTNI